MSGPSREVLSAGRQRWQHGPIDVVIEAWGESVTVAGAFNRAWQRFGSVLPELVVELGELRAPMSVATNVTGAVARRMAAACGPFADEFITPMAAVAGAVADEIVRFFAVDGIRRALINNGGDIAIHLAPGQSMRVGVVPDAYAPRVDGSVTLDAAGAVRGVATSGWRGRSFSLGIADSVTVLARTAAEADAAATMIANAVDVANPAIRRAPADSIKDDSDLGERLVTVGVGDLPCPLVDLALDRGVYSAEKCMARGLILGAALALKGQWRTIGSDLSVIERSSRPALAA